MIWNCHYLVKRENLIINKKLVHEGWYKKILFHGLFYIWRLIMDQVKFFNSIAKDWDNIIKVDEKKINYLLSKIDIKEDDYILDVGTGTGVLIPFLVKLCPKGKIKAVDISCNMLDVARKKFNDINNVEFILLNVETDKLDEKFNKIVLYSMFPHLKDKTNTIKKLVQ